MQIYIHRDGQQFGPYSVEQAREYLAAGSLAATDLAWYEGAADWAPLGQLKEVSLSTPPPPAPSAPAPAGPAPVGKAAPITVTLTDEALKKAKRAIGLRTMGYGSLWLIGGAGATIYSYEDAISHPGGGTHYFFWGAILVGVIQIIKGLIIYVRA